MKNIYFSSILLMLRFATAGQIQERTIRGQLKSNDDGLPLPGVNITIKGTTRGTVTDADGRYSISVPIGSVLVFSFIGMQTREVLVTENNLQPVRGNLPIQIKTPRNSWTPSILSDTTRDRDGVTTLSQWTPSYKLQTNHLQPHDILSIRNSIWPWKKKQFVVNTNNDLYTPKGIRIQFNSAIDFQVNGQVPKLQSRYAQGRNENGIVKWQGPDALETMSWGPLIKTLEYSGSAYPYDRNGAITLAGTGNGRTVNTYPSNQFFQTGVTTAHELAAWFPGISRSTTTLDLSSRQNQGIVPNNSSTAHSVSWQMKRISLSERLKANVSALYSVQDGNLLPRGANLNNVMRSLWLTASTFDITNGYSNRRSAEQPLSYQLPDGATRSSAPGLIDNPYGLVATLPDQEQSNRLLTSMGFTYSKDKLDVSLHGTFDRQVTNIITGVAPGFSPYVSGRKTDRDEERNDRTINFLATYRPQTVNNRLSVSFGYQFRQENRAVNRNDGFGFSAGNFPSIALADSLETFQFALTRNIHEVLVKGQYDYNGLDVQFNNRNYFSNTIPKKVVNLFPTLIVKVDLDQLLYIDFLNELKPYASIARTIREAPALFGNSSFLSTKLDAAQFNQYFENREIVWNDQLNPETEVKFETGLRAHTHFNLSVDFSYYHNTTYGLILPIWNNELPQLVNAATLSNRGSNIALSYNTWNYNKLSWGVSLRWTKYNSIVTQLDRPEDYLPLAGFNNMLTAAAKDQPVGSIYGTSFLRDGQGRKIIDSEGFPMVDTDLKKIGNPIPDYLISLEPYLSFKQRLKLSFIVDFKQGGEVWNGTRAALDYSGRSQHTAIQRNTANYVFDGVTVNGVVNSMPVSFYDPALPLQQNRWVRYGLSGVGEEYIEDASWIRLNELAITYKFYPLIHGGKKEIALSFIGKNLLLLTPYSGVDPSTALYNYSMGNGLDMFNAPALKSYNFLVTLKF